MEQNSAEKIAPLSSIAPSIFVPLRDDILTAEPPRDRIERLKRILQTIDYQRVGIKENLLYMFEREKRRIVLEAAEIEQQQGPPKITPGLAPNEVDEIIANMESPAEPGKDYNVRDMPGWLQATPVPPDAPLRDQTVMQLLNMAEKAVFDLEGFNRHMDGIQKRYLDCLEQETARFADIGKSSEGKSGFKGV